MIINKSYKSYFYILTLIFLIFLIFDVKLGEITIGFEEIIKQLYFRDKTPNSFILNYLRYPKAITAILVGSGLGICGLLMQTFFKNPLSGPYVLGISSGASLGVGLLILTLDGFNNLPYLLNFGTPLAAIIGAFGVLFLMLFSLKWIQQSTTILIIGLMIGNLCNALINILSYFSNATQLQKFVFWSFGNLQHLTWNDIYLLSIIVIGCFAYLPKLIKPLNALLLGENYALSLGISIQKTKKEILIISGILTGIITAFVGPISFVGLAIPHITKLIFNATNHRILIPGVILTGAILMLLFDILSNITIHEMNIPINAITSLFGTPIVIWLLFKNAKKI